MDLRRISQISIEKLGQLRRSDGFLARLVRSRGVETGIIADLGETGETGLLPELVEYALDSDRIVREAAHKALTSLIACVPVTRLLELDSWMREALNRWGRSDTSWMKMQPPGVTKLAVAAEFGPLALASMHPNGRVREAAVRALAERTDGSELPFLLVRLNDWVGPVRDAVRALVSARVRPEYAAHFLGCIPLMLRVEKGQRGQHEWLTEAVTALFNNADAADAMQRGLHSADGNIRRVCLRMAVCGNSMAARAALSAALDDPYPMSRLWALKQLTGSADLAAALSLHQKLSGDPFMPVRLESLTALVSHGIEAANDSLTAALLDRHSSVRELARFHLRNRFDVAGFYRCAIQSSNGAALVAAIRGLGEYGTAADTDRVRAFSSSPEIRVRRAAVAACGKLGAEQSQEALLGALADVSPGVSAEARSALALIAPSVMPELASLLANHPAPFVRKNALRLVCRLSKWARLPLILRACRDASESVAQPAAAAVSAWLARYSSSYMSPGDTQLSEAHRELMQSQEFLSSGIVQNLTALIAEWRKK